MTVQVLDSIPLLRVSNLQKSYGSYRALRGISFDMSKGEIISVLGPSGCGKSTLLSLVAGLAQPDEGSIHLNGEMIASRNMLLPPEKRGINMVFQDYALWPHMNVADNIGYGLKRMKLDHGESNSRTQELLSLLRLEGLEKRLPPQLSGGQQQRVAIARALATRPQLMLLDEPLSNLDMRLRVEMRTEMAYLFRRLGISVFHVTHDPEEAFSMADRLLIMREGAVDQLDTPQTCFERPASRWSASLMGAINSLKGTVHQDDKGGYIRIGQAVIRGSLGAAGESEKGVLMFRPEQVKVVGHGDMTDEKEHEEENLLGLRIIHCSYEGTRWRAAAETNCMQRLYIIHESPLASGERITARLSPEWAYIYRNEDER